MTKLLYSTVLVILLCLSVSATTTEDPISSDDPRVLTHVS